MINTIFYFPQNKAEYNDAEISDRTISFVPDEKAIYKNGIRYGASSNEDLKTQIEQIFRDNPYTLPIATASRLGGIMIGKGFSIDPESGKLDVDFSSISGQGGTSGQDGHNGLDGLIKTIFENVTNLRASTTQYGIVKIKPNGGIAVNDGVISVDTSNLPSSQLEALRGPQGPLGPQGPKGDPGDSAAAVDYSITGMSVSGTTLSIAQNNNSRTLTVTLPTSGQGGGEPDAYLKDASASGNTLTITKKNGTQVTFTPSVGGGGEPAQYIKTASASGNTLTLTPNTGSAITFTPSGVGGGEPDKYIKDAEKNGNTLTLTKKDGSTISFTSAEGGSTVSLERIQNSGTQIAKFTIDGVVTTLFAPTPTEGGGGGEGNTTYIENPYDDAWIRTKFNAMEGRIDDTESDIRDILNETDDEIRAKFKSAFSTYKSLIDYYISTGDSTYSNYTFGNDDCDTWASTRGLITRNANGTYTVGWSSLEQSYNNLRADVTQIQGLLGSGGNDIDYEMLSSGLYAYIQDNYTSAGLSSTWGKFMRLSDEDIIRLLWMSSGVKTYASDSQTFASLMAAAQEYDSTGKNKLQEAYSGVTALVEKDSNGRYIAKTTLTSLVDDSISGILTENSSNSAVADLFARINDVEDETSYISGLTVDVEKLKNGDYITSAILASRIGDMSDSDKDIAFASFATKAALDNVESSMTSSLENTTASIALCVKKDSEGKIESGAKIDADNVIINADHKIALTADNFTIDGDVLVGKLGSAKITATNLDLTGVSFTVNANDINLNGQTNFINLIGNSVKVKKVTTNNVILDDSIFGGILVGDVSDGDILDPTLKISHIGTSYGYIYAKDANNTVALTGSGIYFDMDMSSNILLISTHGYTDKYFKIWDLDSTKYVRASADTTTVSTAQPCFEVQNGTGSYCYYYASGPTTVSDMRLKNVVENINFVADDFKDAPLFKYTTINGTDINTGTSAQYWQTIIPDAVIEDENGYLALNYSKVATVTAITAVKEIAALKAENTALKERVEALEARLQLIENKLNAQ